MTHTIPQGEKEKERGPVWCFDKENFHSSLIVPCSVETKLKQGEMKKKE